jgi:hypothetical protein
MTPKRDRPAKEEIVAAAAKLGVQPAAMAAVAEVESGPQGAFDDQGRPTILYERHVFDRLAGGRFLNKVAEIGGRVYNLSSPVPGGYGLYRHQWPKLLAARKLDAEAADKSCSWGLFQIMGENHLAAGFEGVEEFVEAMYVGVDQHLIAFVKFIECHPTMLQALKYRNFDSFAHDYNGPGYAANNYNTKMRMAYERLSATTYKET